LKCTARICLLALFCGFAAAIGATEIRTFKDANEQQRYERLVEELRCLVCQNQSLADSDADLARDLRDEVYQIIQSGKSDEEAVQFLVDRYGDFVLYRPPVKPITWLLWVGPFLALAGGLLFIRLRTRQQATTRPPDLSAAERERLRQLEGDSRK
jgi:cytochrome c-type biogenesis protein CcmH